MGPDELQAFLRRLDPDEVADFLGVADEDKRDEALLRLNEDRRKKVEFLLGFGPKSAGGLMNLDYVSVDVSRDIEGVAERVRKHEGKTGRIPTIFVTEDDELVGELPGQVLAMEDGSVDLRGHVCETSVVTYDTPEDEVVDVFRRNSGSCRGARRRQGNNGCHLRRRLPPRHRGPDG